MTAEEVKSVIDEQRAQGLSDEQMLDAFYDMFKNGKMDKEDLKNVIGVLGYEFTPEFEQDNTESPIDAKEEQSTGGEEITKEEIEDAKEYEPGEENEDVEEKETTESEKPEETEESEDEEKAKAKKLFGLD